jgi:pimeloyl-ACP methyl ester carboxylesterase
MHEISLQKVRVGDIDIAYKVFGKGDPLILFNGASDIGCLEPILSKRYFFKYTVIVFDSRGIGNTTAGPKPYSMHLLANDRAGYWMLLKYQNQMFRDIL